MKIFLGIIGFFCLMFFVSCTTVLTGYNGAIQAKNDCDAQYANVDTVLQRRADLIPSLVETVKGAANFEKSTLESVIQARASATQVKLTAGDLSDPAKMKQFQAAQDGLSSALTRLLAVSENYPDLKANANFRDLQSQLEGTENRISEERRKYNLSVMALNNAIEQFPANIGAGFAHVSPREPFTASESGRAVPKVAF
jgi:LemA protein